MSSVQTDNIKALYHALERIDELEKELAAAQAPASGEADEWFHSLRDCLMAWGAEADEGDGIMEEHSEIFDKADALVGKEMRRRGFLQSSNEPESAVPEGWKLPHDVVINGGMTFRKGVKLSTFVKAAERWHREAMKQYAGISKEEIEALMSQLPKEEEN